MPFLFSQINIIIGTKKKKKKKEIFFSNTLGSFFRVCSRLPTLFHHHRHHHHHLPLYLSFYSNCFFSSSFPSSSSSAEDNVCIQPLRVMCAWCYFTWRDARRRRPALNKEAKASPNKYFYSKKKSCKKEKEPLFFRLGNLSRKQNKKIKYNRGGYWRFTSSSQTNLRVNYK